MACDSKRSPRRATSTSTSLRWAKETAKAAPMPLDAPVINVQGRAAGSETRSSAGWRLGLAES